MPEASRGRALDTAVGDAALAHTLRLLDLHGYDGLRMKDVASAARIGLGALYRRWSGKHDLVVAALRASLDEHASTETDDAHADLVAGLLRLADGTHQGLGRLVAASLRHPDSELARVVSEAKLDPIRAATAGRLQRIIGAAPDLLARADIGPAMIFYLTALHGTPPSQQVIESDIVPLMTGGAALP
jgi:AcrR family transcriptional regulator